MIPSPRMNDADQGTIEGFVRGTLGCRCPDEVFHSISIARLPALAARPPVLQLLVGSRLLIHIVTLPAGAVVNGWLEQLAAQGRATRDRHGYNRFRLVFVTQAAASLRVDLEARFARATGNDARAHLHLIGSDRLPPALTPSDLNDQVPAVPERTVAK
jgi:hypothetical protein